MDDRMRVVGAGLIGATLAAAAAYLLLTEDGREKLSRAKPAVDDLSRVLQDLRTTIARLGDVAIEGRRAAGEVRAAFVSSEFTEQTSRWQ